jgi:hypothetical protein
MFIAFPYRKKTIEEGIIPYPVAPLPVKTKFGEYFIRFLVDSGADTTTLPLSLAPLFDFKPTKVKGSWVSGVEGGKVAAYSSKVEIGFGRKFYKVRCLFIDSKVTPLLGRLDIWDKFSIVFDNLKEEVVFKPTLKK